MISLLPRGAVTVPVEAESITPQAFLGKRVSDIEALPVLQGNATARLGDFFRVSGDADGVIRLAGDCSRVKYIGRGMTDGRIEIDGDAGMHLGAEMRGGEIDERAARSESTVDHRVGHLGLSEQELSDLVAFLTILSDEDPRS